MQNDEKSEQEKAREQLDKWWLRFQRSINTYNANFEDEQFDDVVVTLVAGALIERLLWIGILLRGGPKKQKGKRLSKNLGSYIDQALDLGAIDVNLSEILKTFKKLRNNIAHNIDFRLDKSTAKSLYDALPAKNRAQLDRAFNNVLPAPSAGLVARLSMEHIVALTWDSALGPPSQTNFDVTERSRP